MTHGTHGLINKVEMGVWIINVKDNDNTRNSNQSEGGADVDFQLSTFASFVVVCALPNVRLNVTPARPTTEYINLS
jgi:hypothetical protein